MTTILLSGRNGQAGWELNRELAPLGRVVALDRAQMDLTDCDSIRAAIRHTAPDWIVNAAAYTAVDQAETEPDTAMQVNAVAPGVLAEQAKRIGALLVHYSTDYVFDGTSPQPYTEDDTPRPLGVYGRSKLAGEQAIAQAGGTFFILRTSWLYGHRGENFVRTILQRAQQQRELPVVTDQIGCPTWARALARSTAELLAKAGNPGAPSGVYHLCAPDPASRFAFAQAIIELARERNHGPAQWAVLRPVATADYARAAARPANGVLSSDKIRRAFGIEMPAWKRQLRDCMAEWAP